MAEEQVQKEGLTLNDLKNLLAVVDYAAGQGAFKGWDTIKQVVMVRDRLAQFIVAATPAGEDQVAVAEQSDTPEVELSTPVVEEAPKKRGRRKKAE